MPTTAIARTQSDYGANDATTIGIPGINISPFTSGQVRINMGDFSGNPLIGYSVSLPWLRDETNVDAVNHWTKIVRNHTFKFGVDVRRIHDNLLQDQTYGASGAITFSEGQTSCANCSSTSGSTATNIGNEMASLLLDQPQRGGPRREHLFPALQPVVDLRLRRRQMGGYAQTDSRFGPPLGTVSSGHAGNSAGFLQLQPNQQHAGHCRRGRQLQQPGHANQYDYFAPRVGFAYRLSEKTVVRGGFGISYTPFEDNTYAYNYPVRANNGYTAPNSYLPAVLTNSTGTCAAPINFTFKCGFPAPVAVTIPSNGIITASGSLLSQSEFYIPPITTTRMWSRGTSRSSRICRCSSTCN